LHALPVLAAVEREFEDAPFVAIGVHSPKFPTERDEHAVREAVRRYGVTHPVVVDSGMRVWQEYGVNAWPTIVLVDAKGYVVGSGAGEPDVATLSKAVRQVLDAGERDGALSDHALPLKREPAPPGALSYPGKVIVHGELIVVADTGHDQVVVCDAEGRELSRIGDGQPGMADGGSAAARFRHPNGLAAEGDTLYVADTGNHAIRRVDLRTGGVTTVAGTGERGRGIVPGGNARAIALRSPWDVAWDGELLYVAMAGTHQIWVYDPSVEEIAVFAGTGHERHNDGPAPVAAFAQPSGLALMDGALYVADSEISTIRAITDLHGRATVGTVCGSGDLFGFGDRDGVGDDVLLQHPIGIAAGDGVLYVADTFNHKVKSIDPATRECRTLFGDGEPERLPEVVPGYELPRGDPLTPSFHEPEGLALRDGELLVADTNNHRIVAVRIADGSRRAIVGG
jgi:DNA-binding beta-propeller fold protein YncE